MSDEKADRTLFSAYLSIERDTIARKRIHREEHYALMREYLAAYYPPGAHRLHAGIPGAISRGHPDARPRPSSGPRGSGATSFAA
jgi:hypothetical protein